MFNRAALIDGKKPPSIPIKTANKREDITIVGERLKPKESSAKEPKFRVEILKN
jgi:hypothetical protein